MVAGMSEWETVPMSLAEFEEEFGRLCDDDRAVDQLDWLIECEVAGGEWEGLEFRVSDRSGLPSGLPVVRDLGEAVRMSVEASAGGGSPFIRGEGPYFVEVRVVGPWGPVAGTPDWDGEFQA